MPADPRRLLPVTRGERLNPENVVSLDQFRINNSRTGYRGAIFRAYISVYLSLSFSNFSLLLPQPQQREGGGGGEGSFFFLVAWEGSGGNSVLFLGHRVRKQTG